MPPISRAFWFHMLRAHLEVNTCKNLEKRLEEKDHGFQGNTNGQRISLWNQILFVFYCILGVFWSFHQISWHFPLICTTQKKWSFSSRIFSLSFSLRFLQIWSHFWLRVFVQCSANLGLFSRTSDVTERSKSYKWSLKLSKRSYIQSFDYHKYFEAFL